MLRNLKQKKNKKLTILTANILQIRPTFWLRAFAGSSPYFDTHWVMSIHKSLFDIVWPSTLRKPESDTDQGDDTQVKKHKFCPKWLGEFHWLKYDSTEK